MEKVLFEVKYPRIDWSTQVEEEITEDRGPKEDASNFLEKILSERTLILLPDRIAASKYFVEKAIKVSQTYHLDTRITEHDSHISVSYSMFSNSGAIGLLNIMELADDISFLHNVADQPITVVLDYYTHAVYMRGHLVAPLNRRAIFD